MPDAASMPAWRHTRNVLCVRMGSLGDVLRCTPALRALRHGLTGRRLTLLTSTVGAAVAPFVQAVDDVIACEDGWMHGDADATRLAALAASVAARCFDGAVVFTSANERASVALRVCRLGGVPLRLAYADDANSPAAGAPGDDGDDRVADPECAGIVLHDVMRQLALVRHLGCPPDGLALSFVPRAADAADANAALARLGPARGQRCLLLHPGARAPAHRYPADRWAQTARGLARVTGLPLVFTGDADDRAMVETIRAGCGVPTHSLAGELGIGPFGALVRRAALLVCGNTCSAEIAAAVGTPVVSVYALTRPHTTPWHVRSRVLFRDVPCRFCQAAACPLHHHACLAGIAPQAVVDAAVDLLSAGAGRAGASPPSPSPMHHAAS